MVARGKSSRTPRTISRDSARQRSAGRPTLDASRYSFIALFAEADMGRMNEDRHAEILHQFPERPRFVVVRIVTLVARMDEHALEAELANGALGLLDECRAAARQHGRETVELALVLFLNLRRIIAPALDRLELVRRRLAAHVVCRIAENRHVDVAALMGVEHVLQASSDNARPRSARDLPSQVSVSAAASSGG